MSLKHVLLGFLIHKKTSGYSLHKRFFRTTRPLLPQVYRALNEMAAAGFVTSKRTKDSKMPARNIFSVTDTGYNEFEQWMKNASDVDAMKETSLHKLWFAGFFEKEVATAIIEGIADKRREELQYYSKLASSLDAEKPNFYRNLWNKLIWKLAFDYILRRAKVEIEWAEAAMEEIIKFKSPKRKKN